MTERSKYRPKELPNRDQLTGRQSRNYLSGRVVSLIRANDPNGEFSAQELINIESLLRDEFQTNTWLMNVCKAIADESVVVTEKELKLYNKEKSDGQEVCVTDAEVEQLHKELNFLRERFQTLKYLLKDLTEKLRRSHEKSDESDTNSADIWPELRIRLKESMDILKEQMSDELTIDSPKDISEYVINRLKEKCHQMDAIREEWLDQQLDQLAMTDSQKKELLSAFNHQIGLRLKSMADSLNQLFKECLRIKEFYEINVREEMSWRTDLNALLAHLESLSGPQVIALNSAERQPNDWRTKRRLIHDYCLLFGRVETQEFDELRTLMETLKQRIDVLSDKTSN